MQAQRGAEMTCNRPHLGSFIACLRSAPGWELVVAAGTMSFEANHQEEERWTSTT
jgi:hypothetical protein